MSAERPKVALLGNPNSGKSTLFNQLTGLRQKVGNFPGVTVEKKSGLCSLSDQFAVTVIDFPGNYSLYPSSEDERIVVQTLCHPGDENHPDIILYVLDSTNLERHFLLLTQLADLKLPIVVGLNMTDIVQRDGIFIDAVQLSSAMGLPFVPISSRKGKGLDDLKNTLRSCLTENRQDSRKEFYPPSPTERRVIQFVQKILPGLPSYQALLTAHHAEWLPFLQEEERRRIIGFLPTISFEPLKFQVFETMRRYDLFLPLLKKAALNPGASDNFTDKVDAVVTHKVLGPLIFFLLMLLVFQAIFSWAELPMNWIDSAIGWLSGSVAASLPKGLLSSFITDGLLAGLGGIVIFVPQIAILFLLISILEEVGYMSRAVFIFDKGMQKFGLNGRSLVALISGGACAIPAIMSTRTIANWKERLITIMVTPLISCSARIPVYVILIGLVVPSREVLGIFNLQGLSFMGLYLLGIIGALGSALVFKQILRSPGQSFLLIELPPYRLPHMKSVLLDVKEKVTTFVVEAGKVILIISVILWALASFGPPQQMEAAQKEAVETARARGLSDQETADFIAARELEASYAGELGRWMEPVIRPLGFDWKIGIALVTSFAAREVFVSTVATLYSVGSESSEFRIRERLAKETYADSGKKVYTFATAMSLLIFYVFAMQCMSTLAVVRRETQSWKWPVVQFVYMGLMAYIGSLITYQILA